MKLIIDCFKLAKGQGKSIGIYNLAKNLVVNLAKENNRTKQISEIVILGTEKNRQDFSVEGVTFVNVPYDSSNKLRCIIWELFQVKKYMKKYMGDRILFPRGYAPLFFKGKDTIIIHDLIPFYYHENFPDVFNKVENFYIMSRLKASIKHAERIITISDYSKKEIERIVPSAEGKITVIYNGLNELPEEVGNTENERKKEGEEYLSAMTSKLPHKNAKGILEAYKIYWNRAKKPLPLKIIGISSVEEYDMGRAAGDVICYPYVKDDKELFHIIAGSRLFLFLSLIEGFGFPPLEAMQLHVPVICSDRTSLKEIADGAAVMVDPENAEETAEKIEKLLSDDALCRQLIEAGEKNCQRFGWDTRAGLYMEELSR
ncbi:MAG: glycosyltransferase family 4 protein [Suilimivivens sp.]